MDARWFLIGLLFTGCAGQVTTWRYEPAPADDDDDATDDDDDDDDDDIAEFEKVLWGEREGDEGWTGYYYADPEQGGELCELEYEVDSWVTTDTCAACDEAWTITRGWEEVFVDVDGACAAEGWTGLVGTSFGVGHDGDHLWADLGLGWERMEDAEGEVEHDWIWFEIWFGD